MIYFHEATSISLYEIHHRILNCLRVEDYFKMSHRNHLAEGEQGQSFSLLSDEDKDWWKPE